MSNLVADKQRQLETLFNTLAESGQFNGAVLVAEQGQVIYEGSFGYANLEQEQPLNKDSIFELASVSKPITALGIIRLAQEGKLHVDDLVEKWIPELPYKQITVKHLLQHTSGLPDYMTLFVQHWDKDDIANNQDMLELLIEHQPDVRFAPNDKWEYSNTGYVLLAIIIERVSGKSFPDFMIEHLFEPLGMSNTRIYNRRYSNQTIDNYAYGYVWDVKEERFVLPDTLPETDMVVYLDGIQGDGTVNSTLGDLLKLDQALYTGEWITKESLKEAFTPTLLNNGETFPYGYGWLVSNEDNRGMLVSHSGGWPGYATNYKRYIDQEKTFIILNNVIHDYTYLQAIETACEHILFNEPYEIPAFIPPRKAIQISSDIYDTYTGCYQFENQDNIVQAEVDTEDDRLLLTIDGQIMALHPATETRYFIHQTPIEVEFVEIADDEARAFILYEGEEPQRAVRID
ncbi:beta-lactamase family protein [Paenibacillus sp. SC116]|uniref:serine hydrolase domain-containing protein n=1 Tax=Paenibacillus sp. SC116 TaxID=2968986 RepID=UPI00215B6DD7|nr:serine hydrolase domain-containing protein [Paenibacillus sp. SC116]MCR8844571.1 beta-lactamase family protein [Paenibacillus sp. SC116]